MTAALINPASVPVRPSVVDATGCHIGVYYDHNMVGTANVVNADIYGSNYFGILVNGDAGNVVINISRSFIHNIGEVPFNGAQHGIGIYFRSFFTFTITGEVIGNLISAYQKGGIVANGRGTKLAKLNSNVVVGQGHVTYIAQNGIQVGYGAMPYPSQVIGNVISANSYIGTPGDASASAGLLVVGGPGYGLCPDGADCPYSNLVFMVANTLFNNDVGVYASNLQADFSAAPTPTNVVIYLNTASSDFCYNQAYQAGISDQGNTDYILNNYIMQGGGYGPNPCGIGIDVEGSISPVIAGNNVPVPTHNPAAVVSGKRKVVPEKP
jgi:hypothetical protein